jgi:hypothetical protein
MFAMTQEVVFFKPPLRIFHARLTRSSPSASQSTSSRSLYFSLGAVPIRALEWLLRALFATMEGECQATSFRTRSMPSFGVCRRRYRHTPGAMPPARAGTNLPARGRAQGLKDL